MNKKYKDSVFTLLFGHDTEVLRELYGALEGTTIPKEVNIKIDTLEDAIFMDRMNDVSFEIGDKLVVLIEHQSTINPNMALRMLLYISRIYEKIINSMEFGKDEIYSEHQIKIPRPEFIVLYNGTDWYPDESLMRLSESFPEGMPLKVSAGLHESEYPSLEITVKIFNINQGHNNDIILRSQNLTGYSALVEKVREYREDLKSELGVSKLDDAGKAETMKKAVQWCIKNNKLKDFLLEHGSEVINMLIAEWNWDDAKYVWQKEAGEDARRQAREEDIGIMLKYGITPENISKELKMPLEVITNLGRRN